MTGVDEVGAHFGLFFLGDVYERVVGDVAGRLEGWVGGKVLGGYWRREVVVVNDFSSSGWEGRIGRAVAFNR